MSWLITKYLITAGLVVLISEVAKRSDKLGALIAALPMVTVLVLIWLYVEGQAVTKIANHAWYTFWYVIPTLPMFLAFPWLITKFGFVWAMVGSVAITILSFILVAWSARFVGVELLDI
ncbi:MAG: DUF3147 family protein [Thiomicrospira sp.]|uniref:DUF3147 family protein n=1 Tax=Thiomicrospira sp. TaxID=935 RepID=UPI0019E29583|nr:DUF3147 family protein [Thiomicrospira sp.]MBE0493131.1 DUF3147 family protein [Thiomicrospira sp.]